jgi:hypothetical protein
MSWTAPMTAVAGSVLTAAQWNQSVRDNLLETAPANASTVSGYFVVDAPNSIVQRLGQTATVTTSETTTSTTYTDLATPGPAVTVTTGTMALVVVAGTTQNSGAGTTRIAYDISGATSLASADTRGMGNANTDSVTAGTTVLETGLTPGSNTFTAKYRVSSGTGTFLSRRIVVMPL